MNIMSKKKVNPIMVYYEHFSIIPWNSVFLAVFSLNTKVRNIRWKHNECILLISVLKVNVIYMKSLCVKLNLIPLKACYLS